MSDTLQAAIEGKKIPDSKKNSVLAEALGKVKSMGGRFSKMKEVSEELADAVIATAETQGVVFAASFAEGYLGEEKMDIGPVDVRTAGGLLLGGYGLYKTMSGKGGAHALALGNGLLATGIGRIGRHAGKALAEKKATPATPPAPAAAAPVPAAAPATAGVPQLAADDIGEIARMVRMTPGTEGESIEGRRRRQGRDRHRRFVRDDE
jgi:hypothetical protein